VSTFPRPGRPKLERAVFPAPAGSVRSCLVRNGCVRGRVRGAARPLGPVAGSRVGNHKS
jgi:hypothetical protein